MRRGRSFTDFHQEFDECPHLRPRHRRGSPEEYCPTVMLVLWRTFVTVLLTDMLWRVTLASD